ncbi:RagB/SusD family nutrient uptake outer membrane protein [Catalinimonas alkaloidigena]|uniref:RagB/SusD family nutrient uptake outer membrane protein n=1 Tax=Catalinimonas alkaloidigena TaxID=1075417 RepID=UPI002405E93B|nr:RagB/SusD family nutrient uptake outer membrane protein [Catalinimonas alkaloidigena]
MKTNIYLKISMVLLALTLGACHDEILELTPPSVLTEADFYHSADDMEGAVLGIYSRFQSRLPRDWAILEMPTDNLHRTGYYGIGGLDELNNLAFTPGNPLFADFWESTYNGIFRANAVLAYIDNPTDYTESQKDQLVGEAHFMRALFYFDLVRMFGGVPKVTDLLSVEEAKSTPRASVDEIYSLVIEDLKRAIDLLPMKENIAMGRAHKSAAVALLGKVYVYREDWENAKTYLDMMSSFNHQLLDDFASLWTLDNEDNDEAIFSIKYLEETNDHVLSTDFLPYFGVTGIAASGLENAFPSWDLHKHYEDEDSRKEVTITEYWKSPGSPEEEPPAWYPYVSKFAVPHTPWASGLDLPVLRYADVVLLRAEVLYHLNQPEEALAELNRVRSRAFGDTSHNYEMSDISDMESFMDKLLLERRLEFAFENERWFDLVRTDRFVEALEEVEWYYNVGTATPQVVNLDPKPYQRYFPIPQNQLDLTEANGLTQNEGY